MIRVKVKATGFKEGIALFNRLSAAMEQSVVEGVCQAALTEFKDRAQSGAFLPPKVRGTGPALIETGAYVASWKVVRKGKGATLGPTGSHPDAGMTNEALGELLEYGFREAPARPHMRIMVAWLQQRAAQLVEKEVRRVLGRS